MNRLPTFKQFLIEKYNPLRKHSSLQVLVSSDLSHRILDWGDEKVSDEIVYSDPDNLSFGREDEPHVTVLHGLIDCEPDDVKDLVADLKPFDVNLGLMTTFSSNDKFDVLKIDVTSSALHELNKKLRNNVEATKQYPIYVPHITIAYVKKGSCDKFINSKKFVGEKFHVNEIVFSSKEGEKTKIRINK